MLDGAILGVLGSIYVLVAIYVGFLMLLAGQTVGPLQKVVCTLFWPVIIPVLWVKSKF